MKNKDAINITYKKASLNTKETILSWFKKKHVQQFYYGDGLKSTLYNIELYSQGINNNGRYHFDHWIAYYKNEPFGFLMTSPIAGPFDKKDIYNKWYIEGEKTFTLDLLIGEKKYLGKGLAIPMIKNFILTICADIDYFLIDPEEVNSHAIHIYKKAGFVIKETIIPDFNPKPHIMMRLCVSDIKN